MTKFTFRPAVCSAPGCDKANYCKGLCKKHYDRVWRGGDVTTGDFEPRFRSKVNRTDRFGCWPWTGAKFVSGYGKIGRQGRRLRAHRVAYELYVGPIPEGMHVLHRCDNPICVNPAHLWLGTHLDNMRDMEAKGRAKWIQENIRRAA